MHPGRKLIEAVLALHARGYGKLRLEAGLSPSGCHWRYRLHVPNSKARGPHGSLGDQTEFSWGDAANETPAELADSITQDFPDLITAAAGRDTAYEEWLREISAESAPDGLFIELWDSYDGKCDHVPLINCSSKKKFPQAPAFSQHHGI